MFAVVKIVGEKHKAMSIHNSELSAYTKAAKRATKMAQRLGTKVEKHLDGFSADEFKYQVIEVIYKV